MHNNKKYIDSKIKKITAFKLLVFIILPTLLCGCWDYTDIDKKGMVVSIGIDKIDTDTATFFGEIAKFSGSARKDSGTAETMNIYNWSAYGRTYEETRLSSDQSTPLPIFLGATRVVVFGTKLAEESIEPYLNRIDGILDYRKTLLAVVSDIPPNDLFKIKTDKDNSVGLFIENNINWLTNSGKALYTTVGEMLSDIAMGDIGYVMPYIGIKDNDIRYLGLAVMKNSKLVYVIDVKESDGALYLLAENPKLTEIVPGFKSKKNLLSFKTSVKKRKISTDYKDNKPIINIDLSVAAELRYQYFMEPLSEDDVKKLEKIISKKIKKDISSIIEKSQNDFESDIFKFAKYFRADFPEIYQNLDWEKEYSDAKVNINVNAKIVNFSLNDPNARTKSK